MKWIVRFAAILILGLTIGASTGCNTFERNTFNTLAAAKVVLDQGRTDYRSGTIPNNACTYAVLNDATAADVATVQAMEVYEEIKAKKGDLSAQTAVVTQGLAGLAPLVAQLQALYTNPSACKKPAPASTTMKMAVPERKLLVGYSAMPDAKGNCPADMNKIASIAGPEVCVDADSSNAAHQ
jgi:hypothetical protein